MFVKAVNYFKMLTCPTTWNTEFGSSHHHKNTLKLLPWSGTSSRMMAMAQDSSFCKTWTLHGRLRREGNTFCSGFFFGYY